MVVETHAHYTYGKFKDKFTYLGLKNGEYSLFCGTLEDVFADMDKAGIAASIEPGVDLASNESILELNRKHPSRIFPAVGVHPTRCIKENWRNRKKLTEYAQHPNVIAIGETGLDYHYFRKDQHRIKQLFWFVYQLKLARRMGLPVVLHVRDAHKHTAAVLSVFGRGLRGVVHCFRGNFDEAAKYVSKGLYLGIGASILQSGDKAEKTREAVRYIPIEKILIETDAPFVPPDCGDAIPKKKLYKACNTSLVLPKVIAKIARLKEMDYAEVERITAQNAIELFSLPISED